MSASPHPENAFRAALAATERGARERWVAAQGGDPAFAAAAWEHLPLLRAPELRSLALTALSGALGASAGPDFPLPVTVWTGGAADVQGGRSLGQLLADFDPGAWHPAAPTTLGILTDILVARSRVIAEKRRGWVVTPTICRDGHRSNASTVAMTALNLDSDGRGIWDRLDAVLEEVGLARLLYQSGGWEPDKPKWHVLIPLARPFPTSCREEMDAWKAAYAQARVAFGALAELLGEGFDPSVDAPSVPVFITERRRADAPPRVVLFRLGRALDLPALASALPRPDRRDAVQRGADVARKSADLGGGALEGLVAALARATAAVPRGRRDLYLALPGALLDRGVDPDDVITICEAVSSRYPRPDHQKHDDNVRAARTTVDRWRDGLPYTRIGTLVEMWPGVARAIGEVLPDPDREVLLTALRAAGTKSGSTSGGEPAGGTSQASPTLLTIGAIRDRLIRERRRLGRGPVGDAVRGAVLGALLRGIDLVPTVAGAPVCDDRGRPYDRTISITVAMRAAARVLPPDTPFEAIAEIARRSLSVMLVPGERVDDVLASAREVFESALGWKLRCEAERAEAAARDRRERLR